MSIGLAGNTFTRSGAPEQLVSVSGDFAFTSASLAPFVTTNATPHTPGPLSVPMLPGDAVRIVVRGVAVDASRTHAFEFDERSVFVRPLAGAAFRAGTSGGEATSAANTFQPQRPSISFADPSGTNAAAVMFTGKAATAITWFVSYEIHRNN